MEATSRLYDDLLNLLGPLWATPIGTVILQILQRYFKRLQEPLPMDAKATYNLILPVGTQVVTRVEVKTPAGEVSCLCGAVGEIVRSPTDNSHTYQIKLPSGVQVNLRRHEFSIRKHYQREGLQRSEDVLVDYSLYDAVIYRCLDWYHLCKKLRELISMIAVDKIEKSKHLKLLLPHLWQDRDYRKAQLQRKRNRSIKGDDRLNEEHNSFQFPKSNFRMKLIACGI